MHARRIWIAVLSLVLIGSVPATAEVVPGAGPTVLSTGAAGSTSLLRFDGARTVWQPREQEPGHCLRLEHRRGRTATWCLLRSGRVGVRHLEYKRRTVVDAEARPDGSVRLPTADLMLRPGRATIAGFCKGSATCESGPGQEIRVPRLRIASCAAHGPKLIERVPTKRKVVALTIDGGPSTFTPPVLRTLKRFNVRATFFVVGQRVEAFPQLVRKAVRQGHEIANHSYSHPHVGRIGASAVGRDLSRASTVIRATTGFTPCSFRAPYLEQGPGVRRVAWQLGMATVGVDVDPVDWASPGVGTIVRRVVTGARPGSVLLMHDGGGPRDQSVRAFPGILKKLRNRGYRFVTLAELADLDVMYR